METLVKNIFIDWQGTEPQKLELLPASGSNRRYFRISYNGTTCIATYSEDIKENKAYLDYSVQLLSKDISIPRILHIPQDERIYFIEDLGDTTLFSLIMQEQATQKEHAASTPQKVQEQVTQKQAEKQEYTPSESIRKTYKEVINNLQKIQIEGGNNFDYTHAYPAQKFDRQSMMWDLNYFKYMFLRLKKISFNEAALEKDFTTLTELLTKDIPSDYFLYRDFQSRNIMLKPAVEPHSAPHYIDFQGGRKGALQYDLASLLYDAKANLSNAFRKEMLNYYITQLEKNYPQEAARQHNFTQTFYGFVLLRILQAMGGYGYRGLYEKKELFIQSIPYAVRNLSSLQILPLPEINRLIDVFVGEAAPTPPQPLLQTPTLTITVQSFSYRKPLPTDPSGNGGGFIFDCRYLPNPGREEKYRQLTGKDAAIIDYLKAIPETEKFIERAIETVLPAIKTYRERGFENLQVNFGCTGGRHRSVYCAENFANKLAAITNANIVTNHLNI